MSLAKKLGIALLVILIVLAAAFWFLTRGDTASVPWEDVVGTDPTLEEPNAEGIPTVAIAEPVGWATDEVPVAAEGILRRTKVRPTRANRIAAVDRKPLVRNAVDGTKEARKAVTTRG